jgi:membrane-associated phospholipid phosphatase
LIEKASRLSFRRSEWILLGYYAYVAALAPFLRSRSGATLEPEIVLAFAAGLFIFLARGEQTRNALHFRRARDWLPIILTLIGFREMELFVPTSYTGRLESGWIRTDVLVLGAWHGRQIIESLGWIIPLYLEFCYLLVYGLSALCIAVFYFAGRRKDIDIFYVIYLSGTLGAYALIPYFPSQPPRFLFPSVYPPQVITWARELNLFILKHGTIHTGVFPSAHVSSAFAAAWAMFLLFPRRKVFGWVTLVYAISVSVATIYGRYHYTADVVSGIAISLAAAGVGLLIRARLLVRDECVEKELE